MNLRDSYRTRPDMHDGFESLSFPPNVFSEVIDRWTSVPRNAPPRAVGSRGSRKTNAAGKRMPDRGCVLSASSGRGEPRSREIFTRRDQRRGKRNVVAAIKKEELGDRSPSRAEPSGAERSRGHARVRTRTRRLDSVRLAYAIVLQDYHAKRAVLLSFLIPLSCAPVVWKYRARVSRCVTN